MIIPEAQSIIDSISSYTEVSPSGTGVKIFVEAKKSPDVKSKVHLDGGMAMEVYDQGRYFTVTEQHLPGTPTTVEQRQNECIQLEKKYLLRETKPAARKSSANVTGQLYHNKDDDQVIDAIRKSRDSDAFNTLFDKGDLSSYDNDHSKGDFAQCSLIAKHYNGDKNQIERIFSRSALSRDK